MRRQIRFLFWGLAIILALPICSMGSSEGTSAVPSLNLTPGARAAGLGYTGAAISEGAESVYWNPADMGAGGAPELFLSHSLFVEETAISFASYTRPLSGGMGFGVGVMYFDAGSINQIDDVGQSVGSFSPKDLAVSGGFSIPWNQFRLGAAAKYVSSKIIHSASAYTADAGISFHTRSHKVRWAFTGQNLMGKLKYIEEEDPLPRIVRLGASGKISQGIVLTAEGAFPRSESPFISGGVEYSFFQGRSITPSVRGGYNQRMSRNRDELSGLTVGGGLSFASIRLDYSWTLMGELGQSHLVSLNIRMM